MKELKMKICGMRDPDNILEVSKLAPDYMGFIFYDKTPRYVGDDFHIPDAFPSTIKKVGVFVNEYPEVILAKVRNYRLDFVQLHGNETVAQCAGLKEQGIGVIKVFPVEGETDFSITRPFIGAVDYFLFDTKGKYYGGNATAFDWSVLSRYDQDVPFFLSGGITPENAAGIRSLSGLNIHAIDVNSGVETRPAYKDVTRIEAIRTILDLKPAKP